MLYAPIPRIPQPATRNTQPATRTNLDMISGMLKFEET